LIFTTFYRPPHLNIGNHTAPALATAFVHSGAVLLDFSGFLLTTFSLTLFL